MNTTVIVAHPRLGVVDQSDRERTPRVGQVPIPGGVFGSAGASVVGTFYRDFDPVKYKPTARP